MIKNKSHYLTSLEVAKMVGLSPDWIRRMIINGKIKATKLGHNWLINKSDIKNLRRLRSPRNKDKGHMDHGSN